MLTNSNRTLHCGEMKVVGVDILMLNGHNSDCTESGSNLTSLTESPTDSYIKDNDEVVKPTNNEE